MNSLTPELAKVVTDIATYGDCCYEWSLVKPVFGVKMDIVLAEYEQAFPETDASGESLADQRTKLHEALDQFQGIPFTVQRFAELLCDPQSIYRSSRKLISALDKVLAVSTTIPQFTRPAANDDATMDS